MSQCQAPTQGITAPLMNAVLDPSGRRTLASQRIEEIRVALNIGVTTVKNGQGLPLLMLNKECPYESDLFKAIRKSIVKQKTLPPPHHWLFLTAVMDDSEVPPFMSGGGQARTSNWNLCRAVHKHLIRMPEDIHFFRQWTFRTAIDTTANLWLENSSLRDVPSLPQPPVPQPSVPQPSLPQPSLPQPPLSQPSLPQPRQEVQQATGSDAGLPPVQLTQAIELDLWVSPAQLTEPDPEAPSFQLSSWDLGLQETELDFWVPSAQLTGPEPEVPPTLGVPPSQLADTELQLPVQDPQPSPGALNPTLPTMVREDASSVEFKGLGWFSWKL